MKRILFRSFLPLFLLVAGSTAWLQAQTVVALQDFDNPLNLIGSTANPPLGSFTSAGDGFDIFQRGVSASIPFDLLDDSAGSFPPDNQGIIGSGKTDAWFGIVDTENTDNSGGDVEATWSFNVAGASNLTVSIDMGAMGDFESSDVFNFFYQLDGGPEQALFISSVDESGSYTYTMEGGAMITLNDPAFMNGVLLTNNLSTFTQPIAGTGSTLTIIFRGNMNGGGEGFAFDNIVIEGETGGVQGCDQLFISEYIEGSGNNKCIEIYNPTPSPVNLAAQGFELKFYFNGNSSPGSTIGLTGTVGPNSVYVVCDNDAAAGFLALADQTSTASFYNGDDAVALTQGGVPVDVIGQIGFDPGSQWGSGNASTQDNTIRRKFGITAGDPNGSDPFDPSGEWDGFPQNDLSGLGSHASVCADQGGGECAVTGMTRMDVSGCNDNGTPYIDDDFFQTNITVNFENAPSEGFLQLFGDDGLLGQVPVGSLSGNSFMFKSLVFPANGENLNLTAAFSADAFCTLSSNLGAAPAFCSVVPACSYLFISEYIEGSGFNKCIEIYNPTSVAIDLDDFDVFLSFNGGTFENDIMLSGVIEPGDVFVLCNSSAGPDFTSQADQLTNQLNFNGNDAVLLRDGNGVIDALGQLGNSANYGANVTLRRQFNVQAGDNNPFDAFNLSEWVSYPSNTFWGLGYHATDCRPALPQPWNPFVIGCQDGDVAENNGTWTLSSACFNPAAGQDDLTMAFQQLCGDGEIIARVSNVDVAGWAGVMFREDMTPGSKYTWLYATGSFWGRFAYRASTNGSATIQQFPNFGRQWLRLTRTGNQFRSYVSSDGVNWQLRGQAFVPMNQCLFVGLALHSNVDGNQVTATFDNVQVNGGGLNGVDVPQNDLAASAPQRPVAAGELRLSPNPARNFLDITATDWVEETTIVTIFDTNGKRLFSDRFDRYGQSLRLDLDALGLPAGMYLLSVTDGEQVMSERFIKQ